MVQIQKQGQKVVVNIHEKKSTVRKRKRSKKSDVKKGVSSVYPFVPPIVITPFGDVHKPPPTPYMPNPITRDVTLDSYKSGGSVLRNPEVPEVMGKVGDFSASNPLVRDARVRRFSEVPSEIFPDSESVSSDITFGTSDIYPPTETGRSELVYEPASSRDTRFTSSTDSRPISSFGFADVYSDRSVSSGANQNVNLKRGGSVGSMPIDLEVFTPRVSNRNSTLPISLSERQIADMDLPNPIVGDSSTSRTSQARIVRQAQQRSLGIGSDVPLDRLLSGRYHNEGENRRPVPTVEQRQRLYDSGNPYKGDEDGVKAVSYTKPNRRKK